MKSLLPVSPDDKSDPRRFRPSQKTKAHKSYVPAELMRQLKTYIETIRAGFPAAKTHEMVFVSEMDTQGTEGQPFSLSSFDALFATLSNALSFKIHPHLLRHKWNELFTEAAEDQGLSSDELDKLRKYAMGWSRNSTMGQLYNEFKDAEAVRELQRARQERIVTAGDEGHE